MSGRRRQVVERILFTYVISIQPFTALEAGNETLFFL